MRILAIDDNQVDRAMLRDFIEKAMLPEDELFVAESGEQGLSIVRHRPVDLVLTDLLMPDVSGLDVLVETKQRQPGAEVVVITASQSVQSAVVAMKKGARDYLTKPLHAGVLIEKINYIRDYLERVREADDYRLAKEVVENAASEAVHALEICCSRLDKLVTEIQAVLRQDRDDPAKIEAIAGLISHFRSQGTGG